VPTNENLDNGDFKAIIEFSLKKRIRENINFPAPVGRISDDSASLLTQDSLDELFSKYLFLENVLPDFKQLNLSARFVCPMGDNVIYILPNGEVCPCTFTHVSFGNILKDGIADILVKMRGSDLLRGLKRRDNCPISMDRDFINKVIKYQKLKNR